MMLRLIAMFQSTSLLKFGPLLGPSVAGIGEDRLLLAVQYGDRLTDVGFVGGGADYLLLNW